MKPILFTKENRERTRTGAKTQTRRVWTDYLSAAPARYAIGEIRYMCEPYVIDSAEHTSKRQVIGEYLDDGKPFTVTLTSDEWDRFLARKQPYSVTQARFMYKSLARTFVEITDLRWEPLQEITEEDAIAEGVRGYPGQFDGQIYWQDYSKDDWNVPQYTAKESYRTLWDSINAARGHAWESNPTVLVVEYKLVTP